MTPAATLVLLPGLDGTEIFFAPLRRALPPWIRTRVVGYPQSGPTSYDDLALLVERAVADLDDFFVLGWSFGGPLALRLAAARPDAVRGVILCASFVRPPRSGLVPWRFAIVPPVVAAVRVLRRLRFLAPGLHSREFRRAKGEAWRRVKARALAARARAALAVDARDDLAGCRAPILYLAASHDRAVPEHNAREILAGARTAGLATIPGHHFALFTQAGHAIDPIAGFLRECSDAKRSTETSGSELAVRQVSAHRGS
jgi:pimeloyl-ACP methyl ester carboxylesterase